MNWIKDHLTLSAQGQRNRKPREKRPNEKPAEKPKTPAPRRPSLGSGTAPKKDNHRKSKRLRQVIIWMTIILLVVVVTNWQRGSNKNEYDLSYSRFYSEQLERHNVLKVEVRGETLLATLKSLGSDNSPERVRVNLGQMEIDRETVREWTSSYGVQDVIFHRNSSIWQHFAINWLPLLVLVMLALFFLRQMQGGQKGIFSFGKARARRVEEDTSKTTFDDVAGAEEAKQELMEIVEFLRDPDKFQRLGGKIPKGVLMVGPPGTGKTYMARAIAGEANVPFFSMSGSDFVEMFVGVGASRVRDLFETGKAHAPCILFVDEIDAVGRHRGAGLGGGHDEREQTLNQLLVEMDGFESNDGVILIAATNRPDVLDPALLRPGRFDRTVIIDLPDFNGRLGILRIHTREVPLDRRVDLTSVAKGTPGLTGADLANLVNEACLLAARWNRKEVTQQDFEGAKDKVMMGTERKSVVISDEEKRITAYHEVGHAVASLFTTDTDPVHKITIIPRGQALGLTFFLPEEERHLATRTQCVNILVKTLGGRAAEQIVFNEMTNGAENDISTATNLARKMVCEWGMSDLVGPVALGKSGGEVFLGREIQQHRDHSEETAQLIDDEVRGFIEDALDTAVSIIRKNRDVVNRIAEALLERESLDREEIDKLMKGETLDSSRTRGRKDAPSKSADKEEEKSSGTGKRRRRPRAGAEVSDTGQGQSRDTAQDDESNLSEAAIRRRRQRSPKSADTPAETSAATSQTSEQPTEQTTKEVVSTTEEGDSSASTRRRRRRRRRPSADSSTQQAVEPTSSDTDSKVLSDTEPPVRTSEPETEEITPSSSPAEVTEPVAQERPAPTFGRRTKTDPEPEKPTEPASTEEREPVVQERPTPTFGRRTKADPESEKPTEPASAEEQEPVVQEQPAPVTPSSAKTEPESKAPAEPLPEETKAPEESQVPTFGRAGREKSKAKPKITDSEKAEPTPLPETATSQPTFGRRSKGPEDGMPASQPPSEGTEATVEKEPEAPPATFGRRGAAKKNSEEISESEPQKDSEKSEAIADPIATADIADVEPATIPPRSEEG